jgi:hypothetical protein
VAVDEGAPNPKPVPVDWAVVAVDEGAPNPKPVPVAGFAVNVLVEPKPKPLGVDDIAAKPVGA